MSFEISPNRPFGLVLRATSPGTPLSSLPVELLREHFRKEHFLLLRGFTALESGEEFATWCERWGEISLWPFGKVLELVERNNPEDHIFDNNYVPLHWDGMYRPQVPEYQIFHCVKAPDKSQGGRTTFSHTVKALNSVDQKTKDLWKKVTGSYQRKMEFYDSKTISPIIDRHPFLGFEVIRYNEPPVKGAAGMKEFVNPPILEFTGGTPSEIEECHRTLREALYGPAAFYAHEWQPGDVIASDNFTLLHGREAFEAKAPRHLQRVHVLSCPPLANPRIVSHR